MLYFFTVCLTYVVIGLACAIYYVFILRKPVLGRFWGALIVGLVGSFLGGLIDQLFAHVIAALADFNSVNIFASLFTALVLITIFSRVSSPK